MRRLCLGLFVLFSLACGGLLPHGLPVQPSDRAVLPDVTDLAQAYPGLKVDPTLGTYSKRHLGNGGIESIYRYKTPDGQQPVLFFESHVLVARDDQAAGLDYGGMKLALTAMPTQTARKDRPDALAWGDEHRCVALVNQGQEHGVDCIARKGRRILNLVVAGALDTTSLSHGHGVDALLGNRLRAIEAYQP